MIPIATCSNEDVFRWAAGHYRVRIGGVDLFIADFPAYMASDRKRLEARGG
jgi:hypothetical protein